VPTYEYECGGCKHKFDEFQQITDKPLRTCPKCKRRKLRRLIGAGAAVLFKGSGFYQTDYRSKEYREKAKAEKESPKPSTAGESKKDVAGDKKSTPPKSDSVSSKQ